jgi:hypothetical protein
MACNETTKLPEPALLVCKNIPRVEGESIRKIMIIGHGMKIVHPENNDHWTQDEIVHPDVRRFWATFRGHSCEKEVCHKNSLAAVLEA